MVGILNCIFVIIGVIIGAGFASGKEIYSFFFIYGKSGIVGIIISTFIIGYGIYKTLKIIKKYEVENYDDFLDIIIGNLGTQNINIKIILNFIINIFLVLSFFVMCAGFIAYFEQELQINGLVSGVFVSIFCFILLNKNIKGVMLLNSILIPMIIVTLISLGIKTFEPNMKIGEFTNNYSWITNAILYASYNSITLISILIPMKKYIKNKKDILKISLLCILIIILLSGIVFILLSGINTDIEKIELPTVYVARMHGTVYKYLYGMIIVGAIATTAISSAYAFLNNIAKNKRTYKVWNYIICFIAIFMGKFGFSNLINNLYPIFGILGLVQLIFILKSK